MLGLEFWVRFRGPVYADETIVLEWLVVKVTTNQKLNGEIVELRGRIKGEDGRTAVGAKGARAGHGSPVEGPPGALAAHSSQ